MDPVENVTECIAHRLRANELQETLHEALRFGHGRPTLAAVRARFERRHGDVEVDDDIFRREFAGALARPRSARRARRIAAAGQLALPFPCAA